MSEHHPYLPALHDSNVGLPGDAGTWGVVRDRSPLGKIAAAIEPDDEALRRGVSSVPDIWARALLFKSVLHSGRAEAGDTHAQHIQAEWRALMSLLALRELHNLPVRLVGIVAEGTWPMLTALGNLSPDQDGVKLQPGKSYPWTNLILIKYGIKDNYGKAGGVAVGAFSPATLVYAGAGYMDRLDRELPYVSEDGRLKPPVSGEDLGHVRMWLEAVIDRYNQPNTGLSEDSADADRIFRLLRAWEDDLSRVTTLVKPAKSVTVGSEIVEAEQTAKRLLETYDVFGVLARPLREEGQKRSDVLLRSSRRLGPWQHVVVVNRTILERDLVIWNHKATTFGANTDVLLRGVFKDSSGIAIGTVPLSKDAAWIRPEDFFLTHTLLRTSEGSTWFASAMADTNLHAQFVLPLTPAVLDYFSPEEIASTLQARYRVSRDEVTFSLSLPIGDHETVTVERTYRATPQAGEGKLLELAVPVIEMFPHNVAPEWRTYWFMQDSPETVIANAVVPGLETARVERQHRDKAGTVRLTKVQVTPSAAIPTDEGAIADIRSEPSVRPEAIALKDPQRGEAWGLILLPVPVKRRGQRTWRIGLDFGTSNTQVFRKDTDGPLRWDAPLDRHLLHVTAGNAERRDALSSGFLLPDRTVQFPILTALRVFEEATIDHVVLDYGIPFADRSVRLPANVYTNLKDVDFEKRRAFLESLLLLIMVDAASTHHLEGPSKIDLLVSYPKAFSTDHINGFEQDIDSAVGKARAWIPASVLQIVEKPAGMAAGSQASPSVASFVSESRAAALYFKDRDLAKAESDIADTKGVAACVDVGGGTTDISIWNDEQIVIDASVLLAGGNVAEWLARKSRLVELLFLPATAAALNESRTMRTTFSARLNLALRLQPEHTRERLSIHRNDADLQWLKRLLVVQFGAIAAYTAMLVLAADRKKKGQILPRLGSNKFSIHWGGNASKLINWIDNTDQFNAGGNGAFMLNAVVYQTFAAHGVKVDGRNLAQSLSRGPKEEVAGGLTVNAEHPPSDASDESNGRDQFDGATTAEMTGVVSGEDITLDSGPVDAVSVLTLEQLCVDRRSRYVGTEQRRLSEFIEQINVMGVRRGVLDGARQIRYSPTDVTKYGPHIATELESHYATMARHEQDKDRVLEPPFILEVKKLLRLLQEQP